MDFSFLLDGAIVFAPVIGYVFQYKLIKETQSVGNFSIDVCAILIFCNILRIFFWFGKYFETSLLLQSIFMITAQIILLKLCIEVNNMYIGDEKKENKQQNQLNVLTPQYWKQFWRWNHYYSYIYSIISFTIGLSFIFLTLYKSPIAIELIGMSSAVIEACLGLPQAIKNYKTKQADGLSYALIGSWFGGDSFKTIYFFLKNAPQQFKMCGITQLIVDIVIILQIKMYKNQTSSKKD